ncbi:TPA: DUF4767 domain-containing protein [Streptococcus suis]
MKRHLMGMALLVSLSQVPITKVQAQDYSEFFAAEGVEIKSFTNPKGSYQYLGADLSYMSASLTHEGFYGDTDFMVYDPQTNKLAFDLSKIDMTVERKYEVWWDEYSTSDPLTSLYVDPEPDQTYQVGEYIDLSFKAPYAEEIDIPDELTLSPDFYETKLTGSFSQPGTYPVSFVRGGNGYYYSTASFTITVQGQGSDASSASEASSSQTGSTKKQRLIDLSKALTSHEAGFTAWSAIMGQRYETLYPQAQTFTVNQLTYPDSAIGEVYYNGQLIKTGYADGHYDPDTYAILDIKSNHNDPNRTEDPYIYLFTVKDGVGYPFIVDMAQTTDKVVLKITANEDLRRHWEQLVQSYPDAMTNLPSDSETDSGEETSTGEASSSEADSDTSSSDQAQGPQSREAMIGDYLVMSYEGSPIFDTDPSSFELHDSEPLTDDTIYDLGWGSTQLDPFLASIAVDDMSIYLSKLPRKEAEYRIADTLQLYLPTTVSKPVRIKAGQKIVKEIGPHVGGVWGLPEGLQLASEQFGVGYISTSIVGQAQTKGTYPITYNTWYSGGANYLHFFDLIVE